MKHTYTIYDQPEHIAATIEADASLPHLIAGGHLNLETDDYHSKPGKFLKIKHVEVVMSHLNGQLVRNDIHVHCIEQDRTPQQ